MTSTSKSVLSSRLLEISKLLDDGSNYQQWKYRINTVLDVQGLREIVTGEEKDPGIPADTKDETKHNDWLRRDKDARAQITLTISDEPLNGVLHCTTAKQVFDKLEARYEGRGRQTTAYLIGELFRHTLSDDSDMETQLNAMRHTAFILRTSLGCPLDDMLVAAAMINALPPSYSVLKTILMFSDDSLNVDKTISQILNEEKSRRQEQGLTSALVARTAPKSNAKGKSGKNEEKKSKKWSH